MSMNLEKVSPLNLIITFTGLSNTHNKPGRGSATIWLSKRSAQRHEPELTSPATVFRYSPDYHTVQYLYRDENFFYFMD